MGYMIDTKDVKKAINELIVKQVGWTVQSGPFKEMTLLPDECWHDGNMGPKLLGCYEQELHVFVEREIKRLCMLTKPALIVNVGCAEGFYAVGLARRVPGATVSVFDVLPEAIDITRRTAAANGVQVDVGQDLVRAMKAPDLIVMDCEGAETLYLDLDRFPGLAYSNIIVECHDSSEALCNPVIYERFKATHQIDLVIEGPRNPNDFRMLWEFDSATRWIAVSEGRPCIMNWLVLTPFQPQPRG